MKKLLILILLLTSCATQQAYIIPQPILDRSVPIHHKAFHCLKLSDDGISSQLFIHPDQSLGAWVEGDHSVHLTEGLFKYDNDTIAFIVTHELSHAKLRHVRNRQIVSVTTTGIMMAVGFIIPGAGLLNHLVNPAVTNNFSKPQELDADRLASETIITCFDIPVDKQVQILRSMQSDAPAGGGFWDKHPSWADRIENINKHPR